MKQKIKVWLSIFSLFKFPLHIGLICVVVMTCYNYTQTDEMLEEGVSGAVFMQSNIIM